MDFLTRGSPRRRRGVASSPRKRRQEEKRRLRAGRMLFTRGGFPMRRMGVAVLAGLLAWLAAPARAPAQVSQLVNFALYPESQIQLSVEGSGSDTRTQSNGEETLTKVEGASALAAWAPLPLALGVTQDDQHFLQESPG